PRNRGGSTGHVLAKRSVTFTEIRMQELVNFVGGPGVLFIVFISAAAGITLWVMAPKAGSAAVAWIARVCVGGIALFNLALLLAWYQGF
ncbi:hypothetical protein ACPTKW_27915, partial [Pseudomonas aeruginosa]